MSSFKSIPCIYLLACVLKLCIKVRHALVTSHPHLIKKKKKSEYCLKFRYKKVNYSTPVLVKCFLKSPWRLFPSIISSSLIFLQPEPSVFHPPFPGSRPHSPCQPSRHVPRWCFVFFLFDFTGNKIRLRWDYEQALNCSYFVAMSKKVWSNRGKKKENKENCPKRRVAWQQLPTLCEFAFIRLQRGHLERLQQKSWFAHTLVKNMNNERKRNVSGEEEENVKAWGNGLHVHIFFNRRFYELAFTNLSVTPRAISSAVTSTNISLVLCFRKELVPGGSGLYQGCWGGVFSWGAVQVQV